MAVVAFMFGGVLGVFCGLIGWLVFDLSLLAAICVYFSVGALFAVTTLIFGTMRPEAGVPPIGAQA